MAAKWCQREGPYLEALSGPVCEQSCQLLGLDRGDFIEGAEVVGAATLNDVVLSADAVVSV
jgi:predicted peroxiredoxin